MRSGRLYTHPRFMDVTFKARQLGFYGGRYKFKAEWYVRGNSIGVTTKHELSVEKAKEFEEVKFEYQIMQSQRKETLLEG